MTRSTATLRRLPRRTRQAVPAGLLVLLAGCAAYRPLPLPTSPPLAASWHDLRHAGALRPPLSVAEVAALAVENDPALRAARASLGVARAQVLDAGILPNP